MKNVIVLVLLVTLCFFCEAKAQTLSTKILRIEVDGKAVQKRYKVFFLSGGKWIESERTSTGFVIPNELKNEEYLAVLITFKKYKLAFTQIHISKFSEDWIVGVDKEPFSEEFVTREEAKSTRRAYYIEFVGSGLETQLVVKEKKNK